jgi:ABC-type amino acid transport substrate-binding protein
MREAVCLILCALALGEGSLKAASPDVSASQSGVLSANVSTASLKVAVYEAPPFIFKDKNGSWTGLSIQLWEEIAARLGLTYSYVPMPLDKVVKGLGAGTCDLCPSLVLSIHRAGEFEFTEPYLYSHGAVVTLHKSLIQTLGSFRGVLLNRKVMIIMIAMFLGMILFSLLLTVAERKHPKGHFSGSLAQRLGSSLWFSAVTMTTVGYGDKTPLSPLGRLITFFWMLAGVLIIALFTGAVASDITRAEMRENITSFSDLTRFHVGCITGSRMDSLLATMGIPAVRYELPEDARKGFESGRINAFAADMVSLDYLMNQRKLGDLQIYNLPDSALFYAFGVRNGLPQLSAINRELLGITLLPNWRSRAEQWTGPLKL